MENGEVIFYTIIVVSLFSILGLATYIEFRRMSRDKYTGTERDAEWIPSKET